MTATNEIYNISAELGCSPVRDAPMCEYTTFRIGGPADLLVNPDTDQKVAHLLKICHFYNKSVLILGRGSNILISDKGFNGVVICTSALEYCMYIGNGIIECGSGVRLAYLCNFALAHGLSGIEFASGIPGSAGGAAYMNAGAYNGEMKQVLLSCNHITEDSCFGKLEGGELDLNYRKSAYSINGFFITGIRIQLQKDNKADIKDRMTGILNHRSEKQPLDYPSAGSIFKRPQTCYAGELIEKCGLKGKSIGGARVSEKHAGFIVNTGNATADDVLRLIEVIQNTVFKDTGIALETEIKFA